MLCAVGAVPPLGPPRGCHCGRCAPRQVLLHCALGTQIQASLADHPSSHALQHRLLQAPVCPPHQCAPAVALCRWPTHAHQRCSPEQPCDIAPSRFNPLPIHIQAAMPTLWRPSLGRWRVHRLAAPGCRTAGGRRSRARQAGCAAAMNTHRADWLTAAWFCQSAPVADCPCLWDQQCTSWQLTPRLGCSPQINHPQSGAVALVGLAQQLARLDVRQ